MIIICLLFKSTNCKTWECIHFMFKYIYQYINICLKLFTQDVEIKFN